MRILLVNDDGYSAKGIYHLARAASKLGEVWIVAPSTQCSSMSHRVHFRHKCQVKQEHVLDGVQAFSVDGTPADCVKIAVNHILPEKPDIVFSGINYGYNTGIELLYSGTVAAAMEALLQGIPAVAFSMSQKGDFEVAEQLVVPVFQAIQERTIDANEIWNVNFPPCSLSDVRGTLFDRIPTNSRPYNDKQYTATLVDDGVWFVEQHMEWIKTPLEEDADLAAVRNNYVSVGKVRNMVLRGKTCE